jgi:N-acetylglucosamine malate deacetylase 1
MKKNREDVLVVAPHPDDETLGCGGTLLRHKAEGAHLHWLILTAMPKGGAWSPARMAAREKEIRAVAKAYGFATVTQLGYPAARLDAVPRAELVGRMVEAFKKASPRVVYVPHRGDVHSDHRVAAEAAAACVKWFRQGSVKRVLAYEALS